MADDKNSKDRAEDSSPLRKTFKRGNINFDVLEPDGIVQLESTPLIEHPYQRKRGKRGLFDEGRPNNPVTRRQLLFWSALFAGSSCSLLAIVLTGQSLLWLLGLPVLLASWLWSVIMLSLFKARPR